MIADNELRQDRAEFYLCLSRAFLTPDSEEVSLALREALADDLEELGGLLGYDFAAYVEAYRVAVAAIPDAPSMLQTYSSLFLAPPRRVSINTGAYLDGAVNGGTVLAMEEAYGSAGLQRDETFRDLSDHLAVQLEFVASRWMAGDDDGAGRFLARFVKPALPAFIADMAGCGGGNPWLHLGRMLEAAVACDARAILPIAPSRQQRAISKARHERALQGVTEEDMAFIAERLREKGLATDHLAVAPEQRDEAHGWSRRVPPSPRRGSRLG